MIFYALVRLTSVAVFALSVLAQTITTTDAAGDVVVEVITLDINGLPTTSIVSTATPAAVVPGAPASASSSSPLLGAPTSPPVLSTPTLSTPSSTSSTPSPTLDLATTTAPDVQQGPVGAPPATSLGPTIYTYTTTDGSGDTIAVVDTFTPTFPTTSSFTPVSTGTVLPYSQWLSIYGGGAAPSGSAAAAVGAAQAASSSRRNVGRSWVGISAGWIVGLLGGVWVVAL